MKQLLLELLDRLEAVGDREPSLFDIPARDRMADVILRGFLRPEAGYAIPADLGLPDEANDLVREALRAYLEAARVRARDWRLDRFHKRLDAFQDPTMHTERGRTFEDFFGWANPDDFDAAGNHRLLA